MGKTDSSKCADDFLIKKEDGTEIIHIVWFSNEAHFYMKGHTKMKSFDPWASPNPDEADDKYGLDSNEHTGCEWHYFFFNENQDTVTVTLESCIAF